MNKVKWYFDDGFIEGMGADLHSLYRVYEEYQNDGTPKHFRAIARAGKFVTDKEQELISHDLMECLEFCEKVENEPVVPINPES